jgi:hypothetical protein
MREKIECPTKDKTEIGLQVIVGLENTLEWMRSQFNGLRLDVGMKVQQQRSAASATH